MSALDALTTALRSEVGEENLLTGDAAAAYAVDGVPPAMVVLPADEAQVVSAMRLAGEHRATVFPRGGGSHMALGHTPERVDVVLGLQRLQQQIAYEPADMTTTVQAGMRLADLQQTLGAQGQRLALDPPAATTTTVGGMVAANMSGPRRLLYGSARDLLLGITVVTAAGTRTKAGARVVKNVTGYDLNKLYVGSLGTLAVIVELTLRLHPLPPGEHTLGIGFSHHADMAPMLRTLTQLPLRLNSLEILNRPTVVWLTQNAAFPPIETPYLLLARVEGPPEVTDKQVQRMVDTIEQLPPNGAVTIQTWTADEQTRLWDAIEAFPVAIHAAEPQGVMGKVTLLLSDLPALFHEPQAASDSARPWPILAHAGNGIAYVSIPPDDDATANTARMVEHLQTLDACVSRLRGRRIIERAPVDVKRQCDVWGAPGDDFALMRAIKASFDPDNRLNPGRFIGGL